MQKELKLKDERKVKLERRMLPPKALDSIPEFAYFKDYVRSDMAIEVIREVKRLLILELDIDDDEMPVMKSWIEQNVLQDDETKIYIHIMDLLDP
jgi:hypothetical protein